MDDDNNNNDKSSTTTTGRPNNNFDRVECETTATSATHTTGSMTSIVDTSPQVLELNPFAVAFASPFRNATMSQQGEDNDDDDDESGDDSAHSNVYTSFHDEELIPSFRSVQRHYHQQQQQTRLSSQQRLPSAAYSPIQSAAAMSLLDDDVSESSVYDPVNVSVVVDPTQAVATHPVVTTLASSAQVPVVNGLLLEMEDPNDSPEPLVQPYQQHPQHLQEQLCAESTSSSQLLFLEPSLPSFAPTTPSANQYRPPIRTSSGLILTHRRALAAADTMATTSPPSSMEHRQHHHHPLCTPRRILHDDDDVDYCYGNDDNYYRDDDHIDEDDCFYDHNHPYDESKTMKASAFRAWFPSLTSTTKIRRITSAGPMEVEYHTNVADSYSVASSGSKSRSHGYHHQNQNQRGAGGRRRRTGPSAPLRQVQRLFRLVRVWMILSCLVLTIGTAILFRHARRELEQQQQQLQQRQLQTPLTTTITTGTSENGMEKKHQLPFPQTSFRSVYYPLMTSKQYSNNKYQPSTTTTTSGTSTTSTAYSNVVDDNEKEDNDEEEEENLLESAEQIILVPLTNMSQFKLHHENDVRQQRQLLEAPPRKQQQQRRKPFRRILRELRQDFEGWVAEHGKSYASHEEREQRFRIWAKNHQRTVKKNERHGPCPLTNTPIFGSNLFKDLTPEEFKKHYLTGYHGPKADSLPPPPPTGERNLREMKPLGSSSNNRRNIKVLRPDDPSVRRHPDVHQRLLEMGVPLPPLQQEVSPSSSSSSSTSSFSNDASWSTTNCNWYDVSCWLRWLYNTYGLGFGGTLEPNYDSDTYPTAMDWRDVGAVTSIHSQGNCGACWAITAVETIESANFIATGNLYELSESEIILCDNTCQMCNGGWPQNAYEYAMKHNGLPLEKTLPYNGDLLLAMTMVQTGESDEMNTDTFQSYLQSSCPNNNNGGGKDNNRNGGRQGGYFNYFSGNSGSSSSEDAARYGQIKGYGYATERCICYSDGSGCNCDKQNEKMAVMNLASHGPATVCLEASLWQDYTGGIITSEIGCSAKFLDMNHCVQAVGYAYSEVEQQEGGGGGGGNRDNNHKGNNDNVQRVGYWIIRNQWSSAWGMNGYAYVAMGENTCGVLNDMTQAYF